MEEKEEIVLITTRHKDEKLKMTFTVMYQEYTRQEAIERMAKAIRERACEGYLHKDTDPLTSTASAIDYAEAALNALLEEQNER